jgi:DNA adenine methylase
MGDRIGRSKLIIQAESGSEPQLALFPELNLTKARPFVKWAGGKTQLLSQIEPYFPLQLRHGEINRYVEPFIGGGAVFFHVAKNYQVEKFHIFDVNPDLILAYRTIQRAVDELIAHLRAIENTFRNFGPDEQARYYYETRSKYNLEHLGLNYEVLNENWLSRTAQLIFLNRTCFNGLYRVNSKGQFNVPFGRYKNPTICDPENLRAIASILQKTTIMLGDFSQCEQFVDKNSFVYFDPPYRPLNSTANFTGYAKNDFDDLEQLRLSEFYRCLDKSGAKLMLSNSDPKNENPTDEFFEDAYANYRIIKVKASRLINRDATKRGAISELLIMNY